MMRKLKFIPLTSYHEYPPKEMLQRTILFKNELQQRRSVRHFSDRPVPLELIRHCVLAAGSSPSGANMQPWHFSVVGDPVMKRKIRIASEKEEHNFYHHLAPKEWIEDIEPLGTTEQKPFLEQAPYLIVIFSQTYRILPDNQKKKNYYVSESVGIATGILITAIHHAGLVSLTHTPSPMQFLNRLLQRPRNEKPFMILVVGYPAEGVLIPDIKKKPLEDIATFI